MPYCGGGMPTNPNVRDFLKNFLKNDLALTT